MADGKNDTGKGNTASPNIFQRAVSAVMSIIPGRSTAPAAAQPAAAPKPAAAPSTGPKDFKLGVGVIEPAAGSTAPAVAPPPPADNIFEIPEFLRRQSEFLRRQSDTPAESAASTPAPAAAPSPVRAAAPGTGVGEPTMQEILASIRRIIQDDSPATSTAPAELQAQVREFAAASDALVRTEFAHFTALRDSTPASGQRNAERAAAERRFSLALAGLPQDYRPIHADTPTRAPFNATDLIDVISGNARTMVEARRPVESAINVTQSMLEARMMFGEAERELTIAHRELRESAAGIAPNAARSTAAPAATPEPAALPTAVTQEELMRDLVKAHNDVLGAEMAYGAIAHTQGTQPMPQDLVDARAASEQDFLRVAKAAGIDRIDPDGFIAALRKEATFENVRSGPARFTANERATLESLMPPEHVAAFRAAVAESAPIVTAATPAPARTADMPTRLRALAVAQDELVRAEFELRRDGGAQRTSAKDAAVTQFIQARQALPEVSLNFFGSGSSNAADAESYARHIMARAAHAETANTEGALQDAINSARLELTSRMPQDVTGEFRAVVAQLPAPATAAAAPTAPGGESRAAAGGAPADPAAENLRAMEAAREALFRLQYDNPPRALGEARDMVATQRILDADTRFHRAIMTNIPGALNAGVVNILQTTREDAIVARRSGEPLDAAIARTRTGFVEKLPPAMQDQFRSVNGMTGTTAAAAPAPADAKPVETPVTPAAPVQPELPAKPLPLLRARFDAYIAAAENLALTQHDFRRNPVDEGNATHVNFRDASIASEETALAQARAQLEELKPAKQRDPSGAAFRALMKFADAQVKLVHDGMPGQDDIWDHQGFDDYRKGLKKDIDTRLDALIEGKQAAGFTAIETRLAAPAPAAAEPVQPTAEPAPKPAEAATAPATPEAPATETAPVDLHALHARAAEQASLQLVRGTLRNYFDRTAELEAARIDATRAKGRNAAPAKEVLAQAQARFNAAEGQLHNLTATGVEGFTATTAMVRFAQTEARSLRLQIDTNYKGKNDAGSREFLAEAGNGVAAKVDTLLGGEHAGVFTHMRQAVPSAVRAAPQAAEPAPALRNTLRNGTTAPYQFEPTPARELTLPDTTNVGEPLPLLRGRVQRYFDSVVNLEVAQRAAAGAQGEHAEDLQAHLAKAQADLTAATSDLDHVFDANDPSSADALRGLHKVMESQAEVLRKAVAANYTGTHNPGFRHAIADAMKPIDATLDGLSGRYYDVLTRAETRLQPPVANEMNVGASHTGGGVTIASPTLGTTDSAALIPGGAAALGDHTGIQILPADLAALGATPAVVHSTAISEQDRARAEKLARVTNSLFDNERLARAYPGSAGYQKDAELARIRYIGVVTGLPMAGRPPLTADEAAARADQVKMYAELAADRNQPLPEARANARTTSASGAAPDVAGHYNLRLQHDDFINAHADLFRAEVALRQGRDAQTERFYEKSHADFLEVARNLPLEPGQPASHTGEADAERMADKVKADADRFVDADPLTRGTSYDALEASWQDANKGLTLQAALAAKPATAPSPTPTPAPSTDHGAVDLGASLTPPAPRPAPRPAPTPPEPTFSWGAKPAPLDDYAMRSRDLVRAQNALYDASIAYAEHNLPGRLAARDRAFSDFVLAYQGSPTNRGYGMTSGYARSRAQGVTVFAEGVVADNSPVEQNRRVIQKHLINDSGLSDKFAAHLNAAVVESAGRMLLSPGALQARVMDAHDHLYNASIALRQNRTADTHKAWDNAKAEFLDAMGDVPPEAQNPNFDAKKAVNEIWNLAGAALKKGNPKSPTESLDASRKAFLQRLTPATAPKPVDPTVVHAQDVAKAHEALFDATLAHEQKPNAKTAATMQKANDDFIKAVAGLHSTDEPSVINRRKAAAFADEVRMQATPARGKPFDASLQRTASREDLEGHFPAAFAGHLKTAFQASAPVVGIRQRIANTLGLGQAKPAPAPADPLETNARDLVKAHDALFDAQINLRLNPIDPKAKETLTKAEAAFHLAALKAPQADGSPTHPMVAGRMADDVVAQANSAFDTHKALPPKDRQAKFAEARAASRTTLAEGVSPEFRGHLDKATAEIDGHGTDATNARIGRMLTALNEHGGGYTKYAVPGAIATLGAIGIGTWALSGSGNNTPPPGGATSGPTPPQPLPVPVTNGGRPRDKLDLAIDKVSEHLPNDVAIQAHRVIQNVRDYAAQNGGNPIDYRAAVISIADDAKKQQGPQHRVQYDADRAAIAAIGILPLSTATINALTPADISTKMADALHFADSLRPAAPATGATPPATGATPPASGATPPATGATPPATGATPPATGATPPATGATPPASGATPPATGATPPATGATPPATGATPPATGATPPATGATPPATGATPPATGATPPATGATPPATGATPPATGATPPATGATPPATGATPPATGATPPATGATPPATGATPPASGATPPATGATPPATGATPPATGATPPATGATPPATGATPPATGATPPATGATPPATGATPPATGATPPATGATPPATGATPPATGATPPATGATPPATGATPPASGATPPATGATPPATGATPPATGATPPATGATPPASGATPPATGATPPATGATPPATGATPPATGATPPATGATPPATGATPPVTGATPPAAPQDAYATLLADVGAGGVIDVSRHSAAHEDARVAAASILQDWANSPASDSVDAIGALRDKLHLADGDDFKLIDANGHVDHALLDKLTRIYQQQNGLVADGRIGTRTLNQLLADHTNNPDQYDANSVHNVLFGDGGYIGGRVNPLARLQDTSKDATTPPDTRTQKLRDALTEMKDLLGQLGTVESGQPVNAGDKLDVAVHALFTPSADGKPAIIGDASNDGFVLNTDQVKALQKAFGLHAQDGVIGAETEDLFGQLSIRLAAGEKIDPAEIRAAVERQMHAQAAHPHGNGQGAHVDPASALPPAASTPASPDDSVPGSPGHEIY